MLTNRLFYLCLTILLIASVSFAAKYDDRLVKEMKSSTSDSWIPVIIQLKQLPDLDVLENLLDGKTRSERKKIVWRYVDKFAQQSQSFLVSDLQRWQTMGQASDIRSLRIINAVAVKARKPLLEIIVAHEDVAVIMYDGVPGEFDDAAPAVISPPSTDEVSWGVTRMHAPTVWQSGYRGDSIVVAIIDVGVNYNHCDLSDHLWNGGTQYPNHGYDFVNNDNDPIDPNGGHGTSCAGIVAGDGTGGNQTGVAPNALIMAIKVSEQSNCLQAHDFALQHSADITTMSLGWTGVTSDIRTNWRHSFETLKLAGIHNCKSAGNRREEAYPAPNNITIPGDVPSPWRHPSEIETGGRGGLIAVGALTLNDLYASFSSFGPVSWQTVPTFGDYLFGTGHIGLLKPDIIAPGNDILTIYGAQNSYRSDFSGTSAASPHIAGLIALMLDKNYELLPHEVDSIIQSTAFELGIVGKDNDYGAGLALADAAVEAVRLSHQPWNGSMQVVTRDLADFSTLDSTNVFVRSYPIDTAYYFATTDSSGYCLFDLPAGRYVVRATHLGFLPDEQADVVIEASCTTHVAMHLVSLTSTAETATENPGTWGLLPAYPNPFNAETTLRFSLMTPSQTTFELFDQTGRFIRTIERSHFVGGTHTLRFSGRNLTSGTYWVRMTSESQTSTQKLILLK